MGTKVGSVVNSRQAQRDVETIFATGLFEDVKLIINEAASSTNECPKMDFLLDIYENPKTGGLGLGAGWSAQSLAEGALPGTLLSLSLFDAFRRICGKRGIRRKEYVRSRTTTRFTNGIRTSR